MAPRLIDHPKVLAVLFHPRREPPGNWDAAARRVSVTVEPGIDVFGRLYRAGRESPLLLYFHGNGEIAADYSDLAPLYADIGASLLVMDYRGYGLSGGQPTGSNLLADAVSVFKSLRDLCQANDLAPIRYYVMGRSLGSAAALEIAAHAGEAIAGLVIESGFARTWPLVSRLGVRVQQADDERDGFGNLGKISRIATRMLIIHGEEDSLIPISDAEELVAHAAAPDKRLLRIPGAEHNDLMVVGMREYFGAIRDFVSGQRSPAVDRATSR